VGIVVTESVAGLRYRRMNTSPVTSSRNPARSIVTWLLLLLCLPWGWLRLRKARAGVLMLTSTALLGLPLFVVLYAFVGLQIFAAFLPELDLSVGERTDRTIRNSGGNYESTFLKTGRETGGAYELIRVQVQPKGGNFGHYHRTFEESFTTLSGELTVYGPDGAKVLRPGESYTAVRGQVHWFRNETDRMTEMTVRVTPARGLEKTLRVSYGLANIGGWGSNGVTKNPWHMPLILGYSETYLTTMPGIIQEPLVRALARIAQWKGEDKDLKVFHQ
jgi:quercetin dioxygenase-like cupin family protein